MMLGLLDRILARRRGIAGALAVIAGLFALTAGSGEGVDRLLRGLRDGIRTHPASGEIHVVEIDPRSLRELSNWPWPRRHHANLIDRLTQARARTIAFDVDFSSSSNRADDDALAEALDRAGGGVILAAFRQQSSSGSAEVIENIPIPRFGESAFLAAVNVIPDRDGQVRQMLLGLEIGDTPRPSLAAMVAEQESRIDRSFPIDYSIDPTTIPRHSFVDVIRGRVPAASLRGKRIIIGATAIEIGDRYAVPGYGVVPGVIIQALAAETLLAGPPPHTASGFWPLLFALLVIAIAFRGERRPRRVAAFLAGTGATLALPLVGEHWLALTFPVAPALLALWTAGLGALVFHAGMRFRQSELADDATGLPNLEALALAAGDTPIVVARIDRFAALASGLGPSATASLVHRVADRLGFGQDCAVYRIDEAHLAWIESEHGAATLDERLEGLAALMRSPVDCGRLVDVDLAFGIADPDENGPRQQAANALFAAERAACASDRLQWFSPGSSDETDWHLSVLSELDAAMAGGQLWNAYQPKLDMRSGQICGVEALVRWDHPQRGPLGPDQFIPLVEAQGRARDLTLHVLSRTLEDAARWRAAGHDLGVAVNISAPLLLDASFAVLLEAEIQASRVPAECVTLEVTESAAMKDSKRAIAALESWRALGLGISIDDYGTGQSSLAYLQTLPATELKIDKSFVANIASDARNAIMVRSTIALAHELGMKVVAEGVEDAECLASLAEMGCDTAQGWHIGKPMDAAKLMDFLAESTRAAA